MNQTIISGDLIASTSLGEHDRKTIGEDLKELLRELKKKFNVYGRLTEGNDYLDCFVPNNADALRVMLAIKSFVKSRAITENLEDKRIKFFRTHGIRLAIGIGGLSRLDTENGIIDGEAIYYSGRLIHENRTYNKGKIIIKNTLFIKTNCQNFDDEIAPLLALLDFLFGKSTEKQCTVLYFKLLGFREDEIAEILEKKQSTINEHSTGVGWNAVEKAVLRFEEIVGNGKYGI